MSKLIKLVLSACLICNIIVAHADTDLNTKIHQELATHYKQYKDREYFSGGAVSFYIPNQDIKSFYIGTVSHAAGSKSVTAETLFEVGSITKSFTSALILQLEKEHKINLTDTLRVWLPEYPLWGDIGIEALLNMTSGVPNYTDTPIWLATEYADLMRVWTSDEIIKYVYPPNGITPPLKQGYYYSNSNYLLAELIIDKITQKHFKDYLLQLFKNADLKNTFYPIPTADPAIQNRSAIGYNYNQYDNPLFVGKSTQNSLSWMAGAGGIVADSADIVKWIQALFTKNNILDATQKQKLTRLISTDSGESIAKTTPDDKQGYGLGVAEGYNKDIGRYWFYEGETLGFRAMYVYVPCNGIIISTVFNSSTYPGNDHMGNLLENIYQDIIGKYPQLACKT
jgi:D-alanyl-D-alanine carboxypeptidase